MLKHLLVILLLIATTPILVKATIRIVPLHYQTIQEAIWETDDGDTVLIEDGEYYENVISDSGSLTIASRFILDADLNHIANTIIHSDSTVERSVMRIYMNLEDSVSAVGLSITGGHNENYVPPENKGGGIYAHGGNFTVDHCHIFENSSTRGGGIYTRDTFVSVSNSEINDNKITLDGSGIIVYAEEAERFPTRINIHNNNIHHNGRINQNYLPVTGALAVSGNTIQCTITDNYIWNNEAHTAGGGIIIGCSNARPETFLNISGNRIHRNQASYGGGLIIGGVYDVDIHDNEFTQNLATSREGNAINIYQGCFEIDIYRNLFEDNRGTFGAILTELSCNIYENMFVENQSTIVSAIYLWTPDENLNRLVNIYHNLFYNQRYNAEEPEMYATAISSLVPGNHIELFENDFIGNATYAIAIRELEPPLPQPGTMNSTHNYWGDPTGPYHAVDNPGGLGDTVHTNTSILPFSETPFTAPDSIELFFPEDQSVRESEDELFMWGHATDITTLEPLQYFIQISESDDFDQFVEFEAGEDTSLVIHGLDFDQNYFWRVRAMDSFELNGYSDIRSFFLTSIPVNGKNNELPSAWNLETIHPNPFNDSMTVTVAAPVVGTLSLEVYDLSGRLVEQIYQGTIQPGRTHFTWTTSSASGLYLIRASSGQWTREAKIVHLK